MTIIMTIIMLTIRLCLRRARGEFAEGDEGVPLVGARGTITTTIMMIVVT